MYKCIKAIICMVWILDIMNFNVSNISWLTWLEPILNDSSNFNFLFWLLVFAILPSTDVAVKLNKEDE